MIETLLFFSLLILMNDFEEINIRLPSNSTYSYSYVLLDRNIVLVANDTIYFLSSTMELNDSKTINLIRKINSIEEYGNTTIS